MSNNLFCKIKMDVSLIFSGLAALGYAVAAIFSKQALAQGCGILRLSFLINLVFIFVFAALLVDSSSEPIPWELIHLPFLTGSLFFLGQVLTFSAIRMGDVSLQTPVMGTKAVFVVLIALWLGTEQVTPQLIVAAVLSMCAIALLGFSGGGAKRVGLTLALALGSSLFFAGSDTMVGAYGAVFGLQKFLFIAILVNGLLSFLLIPFFNGSIRQISRKAWPWVLMAALAMGLQALLLNYTLARYQNVSAINIIYSSRGLWSVFLAAPLAIMLSLPREHLTARMLWLRGLGALLLCIAIAIVFN
jgi:drug/metabolite transporter (DMT)-like permease